MDGLILLPGIIRAASQAFAPLIEAVEGDVEVIAKDLEVYRDDEPPAGYSLATEVEGVIRAADEAGFERFHLGGYSGGGAMALAVVEAGHGDRVSSLTLMEPAWAGWDQSPAEAELFERINELTEAGLAPAEMLARFSQLQLQPGVEPPAPPPGPPPPWMAKRPAGIAALTAAFNGADLDLESLGRYERPVLFTVGTLSSGHWLAMAHRLERVFPDFTIELFEDRHHFDPPHLAEPDRLADLLRGLWARAAD